jgi:hypothetical protein
VPLFRSLDRISGILQSAPYIGVAKNLVGAGSWGVLYKVGRKDELAKVDGQLLSELSARWRDQILRTPRALCVGNP